MYRSKSLGSKLPQDSSAHRFACPSPGTVHWYEVCPKMTSCTFLKALLRAIFTPQFAARASVGRRGWSVIQSHLGSRWDAAGKEGSKSQILQPPLCTGQTQRSGQGTPSPGRAGGQGWLCPPQDSPGSGMEPGAPHRPCLLHRPALPGCSPITGRKAGAARRGRTCCRRRWPRRTCP